jgi:hypothetical protein
MEPIKSTAHEKGVTALPRAGRRIMDSVDFQDAKNGNPEAVARVVDKIWTEKQTQELAAKLDPNKETIFVSVPSTTGRNRLPDALGEKLARELGGEFAASGFKSETDDAMKAVPVLDRPFSMRNNVLESPAALE